MTVQSTRTRRLGDQRVPFWLFLASVAAGVLPVLVAVGRAIARGWTPLSDDALFTIRARDVFTYKDFPLLGLDSSASLAAQTVLHHPGPLQFDVLALPVRLFGGASGLALGTALINVAAILGIAVFAYRRGGPLTGTVAMVFTAGLCWAMGSEALFEPWQPVSLLLPFLCFAVLAWSVSCGDLVALPVAALVGSFVLQTHVSYVLLVPALAVAGLIGGALKLRADRLDHEAWPRVRRRAIRASLVAGLVLALCWVPPVLDEFIGEGNLGRLLTNTSPTSRAFGYGYGTRLVASVVALPPWWLRPSINHTLFPSAGWTAPSGLEAAVSLAAFGVLLAGCWWVARRRRDLAAGRAIIIAAVGIVAGLATAGRVPITVFGLEAHVFWWLWPLSVFAFFAVALTVLRFAAEHAPIAPLVAAGALVAALLAALALPTLAQGLTPNTREDAIPTVKAVNRELGRLDGKGPILIDPLFKSRIGDPYGTAILAELQRRGISLVAHDPALVSQLGTARRFTGGNARSELYLRVGGDRLVLPSGAEQVVAHQGIDARERRELDQLTADISAYIRQGRLRLTPQGEQDVARSGGISDLQHADPAALIASGQLSNLASSGDLELDPAWRRRFERYAELQSQWDAHTVALFLVPLHA